MPNTTKNVKTPCMSPGMPNKEPIIRTNPPDRAYNAHVITAATVSATVTTVHTVFHTGIQRC